MSRLYLSCHFCERKQADGLLSRGFWGHVFVEGRELHACPTCKEGYVDWEVRLRAGLNGAPREQSPYASDARGFGSPAF